MARELKLDDQQDFEDAKRGFTAKLTGSHKNFGQGLPLPHAAHTLFEAFVPMLPHSLERQHSGGSSKKLYCSRSISESINRLKRVNAPSRCNGNISKSGANAKQALCALIMSLSS